MSPLDLVKGKPFWKKKKIKIKETKAEDTAQEKWFREHTVK